MTLIISKADLETETVLAPTIILIQKQKDSLKRQSVII